MQQHAPAGSPSGGQFLPATSGEMAPTVAESLDVGEGSFDFPPTFHTYDSLKQFYLHTDPPEETLRNFHDSLRTYWADRGDADTQEAIAQWDAANPEPRQSSKRHPGWQAARQQMMESLPSAAVTVTPQKSRALLRLRRMGENLFSLSEDDKQRFWNDRFMIPADIPGKHMEGSAAGLWNKYHLGNIDPDQVRRQDRSRLAELVQLARSNQDNSYADYHGIPR